MPEIILANDSNPGGRKYNEDRCAVQVVTTASGRRLDVAVVCDGVGGAERGERAAQLGIDTFLTHLAQDDTQDTLELLIRAVKQANFAVFTEASRLAGEGQMAATLVAAAVENGDTLYLANAGDSRIYLCRSGQFIQLTRDHSFANVQVWTGKLTAEEAAIHPEANKVMRVLGIHDRLQVDVGLYETTNDYAEANRLGRQGFKLQIGDAILLCSDGLIKKTPATGQTLITEQEIVRILQTQEGEKAARAIMSATLGRIPVGESVDNISLAVLQTTDPRRAERQAAYQRQIAAQRQRTQRRRIAIVALAVALPLGLLLLATLLAFGGFFLAVRANFGGTSTRLAQATLAIAAQTKTASAYTPTPTATRTPIPTLLPTAVPGEIAKVFDGNQPASVVTEDDRELITGVNGLTRYLAVTYFRYNSPDGTDADDGRIYLRAGETRLQFGAVTNSQVHLTLLPGSDVLVWTGPYAKGAEIQLANSPAVVEVRGCLALNYVDEQNFTANCFQGECSYSTEFGGDLAPFNSGTQVNLRMGQALPVSRGSIPQRDYTKYYSLLASTGAGRGDLRRCQIPDLAATQVAKPTTTAPSLTLTPGSLTPAGDVSETPIASETPTLALVTDTPAPIPSVTP